MNELTTFNFDGANVRTLMVNDTVMFVASDVAKALEYAEPHKAVAAHCRKAKSLKDIDGVIYPVYVNQGLDEKAKLIPESDVYRLVMRSKLESAEKFQDWVVEEVLPSIRKTGSYSVKPEKLTLEPKQYIEGLNILCACFNYSESAKITAFKAALKGTYPQYLPALPNYAIDAPIVAGSASSSLPVLSLTEIFKRQGVPLSAVKGNTVLIALGLLEIKERPSTSKGTKEYKAITEKGLKYGKNVTSPNCPRETQPLWYEATAKELVELILANNS